MVKKDKEKIQERLKMIKDMYKDDKSEVKRDEKIKVKQGAKKP